MFRAFESLRPELETVEVAPEDLDGELSGLEGPCFVICSRVSLTVERRAVSWIELYPNGETFSRASISGVRFEKTDMSLQDLLSAVDQTSFSLGGGDLLSLETARIPKNHSFE
jgi:hypothetical protein